MKSKIVPSRFSQISKIKGICAISRMISSQNVIFSRALLHAVLIACMSSQASAQNRVGTIITGRAKATVLKKYSDTQPLPKPQIVLLEDFRMTGDVITQSEEKRHHYLLHKQTPPLTRDELITAVQTSFALAVTDQLKKLNVDAQRAKDLSQAKPSTLVVEGEFSLINQGNARKRILIGFGRGASDVQAHVLISLLEGDTKTLLLDSTINSQSGKEPGAVLSTSGAGFAISAVAGSMSDKRSATVQVDGKRMGKLVAEQVSNVMRTTTWNDVKNTQQPSDIAARAVPPTTQR